VDGVLPFHETIEDMADAYLRAIEAVDSAGPYRLAGYSGGGVVAFEIAQRIWRSGRQVELLAMFDTIASHAARTSLSLREKLQLSLHMPPRRLAKFAVERCKQHLQKQVASSMARGMDPIHRIAERAATAMIRARSRYDAEPYPGDLLLFRATNATMPYEHAGRALGWDRWVRGRIDVVPVRAWHETVLAVPAVDDLARSLAERLTDLDDRRANAVG
jgi:thioesterase domain-containing protein